LFSSVCLCVCVKYTGILCTEESADDADEIAVCAKPTLELKPNSTDEEKLMQSSALAYSFCSDFDLNDRSAMGSDNSIITFSMPELRCRILKQDTDIF